MIAASIIGNFDGLSGRIATGWAAYDDGDAREIAVEVVLDGDIVGTGTTSVHRPDVAAGGLAPVSGFRIMLDIDPWAHEGKMLTARPRDTRIRLAGEVVIAHSPIVRAWRDRIPRHHPLDRQAPASHLSIVMLASDATAVDLAPAISALIGQNSAAWTLVLVAGAAALPASVGSDPRIVRIDPNETIAADLAAALGLAQGRRVLMLEPYVVLEPEAIARFAEVSAEGADLLYADAVEVDGTTGAVVGAQLLPGFSHDLFLARPFFGSCYAVALETARAATIDPAIRGTGDPAYVLRLLERSASIAHLPAVLGRLPAERLLPRLDADVAARHLARIGRPVSVTEGGGGVLRIDHRDPGGRVLIVIPTKNRHDLVRTCVESIRATTRADDVQILVVDHDSDDPGSIAYLRQLAREIEVVPYAGPFNFATINNFAFASARPGHRFVLMMNNDVEAIEPGWLEHMRGLAARRDVGIVGPALLYGNGSIQHAGVIMGLYGVADHSHKHLAIDRDGERLPGYLGSLAATRDYMAVTGACMMMRSALFGGVGGFDDALAVDYNDLDLCLRVGELGLKILYDGHAVLYHHESATRTQAEHATLPLAERIMRRRWAELLDRGDIFYNPMLTLAGLDHVVERLACDAPPRSRKLWATVPAAETVRPEAIDRRRARSRLPHRAGSEA